LSGSSKGERGRGAQLIQIRKRLQQGGKKAARGDKNSEGWSLTLLAAEFVKGVNWNKIDDSRSAEDCQGALIFIV